LFVAGGFFEHPHIEPAILFIEVYRQNAGGL
jgi:hypothetical protein